MHSMRLRLTLDSTATIVAAQAATDAGPYGEACGTGPRSVYWAFFISLSPVCTNGGRTSRPAGWMISAHDSRRC
jgi:Protein of unknown function (DUF2889)